MLKNPLARAPALAQFLSFGRAAPKAEEKPAEEQAPKTDPAEEEAAAPPEKQAEPPKKDCDAEGEQQPAEKTKGSAEDEAEEEAEEDGDDYDEDEEDERDREEMRGNTAATRARVRERARCAAILTHPAAAGNAALAQQLAFGSRLGRKEACAILAAAGAGTAPAGELNAAMAGFAHLRPAAAPAQQPNAPQQIAASWDRAAEKAGVTRRA